MSHYVCQQQRIENAVPLRQKAPIPDSARFLAADENLAFHHQVGDVLEPNRTLMQLAAVLCRNAINHASGIKGAHDFARPLLSFEKPIQKNGENLV